MSPSLQLRRAGSPPAFEYKFLVNEELAAQIEAALRPLMQVDPHADPELQGAYRVTTFYFDTPNWDVLRGVGRHKLQKYRLRKYGNSTTVFVERKAKRGRRVRKRRSTVEPPAVSQALSPQAPPNHPAGWFGRQLGRLQLRPTCRVQYDRRAFFAATPDGPLRLTFDRQLLGWPVNSWTFEVASAAPTVLTEQVICEFKFRGTMPGLFKSVMESLQLTPAGFSKYRHGMWHLQPALRENSPEDTNASGPGATEGDSDA